MPADSEPSATASAPRSGPAGAGVVNFRDASEANPNVKRGRLYRCSQFDSLEGVPTLRTIVDLRRAGSAPAQCQRGAEGAVRAVPLVGRDAAVSILVGLSWRVKAQALCGRESMEQLVSRHYFQSPDTILDMYLRMLRARAEMARIALMLADRESYPVLVHWCVVAPGRGRRFARLTPLRATDPALRSVAGKDRTGIVIALFTSLCRREPDWRHRVCLDYCCSFPRLREARPALERLGWIDGVPFSDDILATPYETMAALLRTVEARFGSVRGYFTDYVGVEAAVLDRVVENLEGA